MLIEGPDVDISGGKMIDANTEMFLGTLAHELKHGYHPVIVLRDALGCHVETYEVDDTNVVARAADKIVEVVYGR